MSKKLKIGEIVWVKNENPKPGANAGYYVVWVRGENGHEYPLMPTEDARREEMYRASQNIEDIPRLKKSWVNAIIKFFKEALKSV